MKTAGIIAEYNPFHNGHLYHIEETRKAGYDCIVAVMSGNVVQRSEVASFSKQSRAEAVTSTRWLVCADSARLCIMRRAVTLRTMEMGSTVSVGMRRTLAWAADAPPAM